MEIAIRSVDTSRQELNIDLGNRRPVLVWKTNILTNKTGTPSSHINRNKIPHLDLYKLDPCYKYKNLNGGITTIAKFAKVLIKSIDKEGIPHDNILSIQVETDINADLRLIFSTSFLTEVDPYILTQNMLSITLNGIHLQFSRSLHN